MMENSFPETIIQLSTPPLTSAIHIIRISGSLSLDFIKDYTGKSNISPRRAYYSPLFNTQQTKETAIATRERGKFNQIDQILFIYFNQPFSYTGEDMVEIHCHGSMLIVREIIQLAIKYGMVPARRGDYTRRAFLNGKMSLKQSEALDILIKSTHQYNKNNALSLLEKKTSFKFKEVKEDLLQILAEMEAHIEFPDEHIEELTQKEKIRYPLYIKKIEEIKNYFLEIKNNYNKGKSLEEGIKLAVIGRPNAGKSTLMNALLREERSIVSKLPGTTRDYLKEGIHLQGVPFWIYDTAGIRQTNDEIERQGILKTIEVTKQATLILYILHSGECLMELEQTKGINLGKENLFLINKIDCLTKLEQKTIINQLKQRNFNRYLLVSLIHSEATTKVEDFLLKYSEKNQFLQMNEVSLLNERQVFVADKILQNFDYIQDLLTQTESEEIICEEMNQLNQYLDELNLNFETEEMLDQLFSSFCIGK